MYHQDNKTPKQQNPKITLIVSIQIFNTKVTIRNPDNRHWQANKICNQLLQQGISINDQVQNYL